MLNRCVAGFEHSGQRSGHAANNAPRRAKIHEHRTTVRQHQNIVRRDIAVIALFVVQLLQRKENRVERFAQPLLSHDLRVGAQHFAQRYTPVIAHGHVGRTVTFPEAKHFNQPRMRKLRQHARFVYEAGQPSVKCFDVLLRAHLHRARRRATGERGRQIFFDGNNSVETGVARAVNNAKPAFANHAGYLELPQARAAGHGARCSECG